MTEKIKEKLQRHFKDEIISINEFRGELTVVLKKQQIVRICQFLRDDEELLFDSLRDVCGIDYYRPVDRFEVCYNIYSLRNKFRLRLRVPVDENDPTISSVSGIWSTANWEERETYDMFGIKFAGHPDLRRIYLPDEFEYYPLRKDFPLMGIPGSLPLPPKK